MEGRMVMNLRRGGEGGQSSFGSCSMASFGTSSGGTVGRSSILLVICLIRKEGHRKAGNSTKFLRPRVNASRTGSLCNKVIRSNRRKPILLRILRNTECMGQWMYLPWCDLV
jgi:hypothetical protein